METTPREPLDEGAIHALERPDSSLWVYYVISSMVLGPLFFVPLIPLSFRYHTLRYRFDDEGVSMRWGILFRREIHLTYARIQDIHLVSNFVERWLGLARIEIQTASGSAKAEMTVEGVREFEALRDFLYSRMRGMKSPAAAATPRVAPSAALETGAAVELTATLKAVAAELRALRSTLAPPSGAQGSGDPGGGADG